MDAQGLVPKAKVRSAAVFDRDEIKLLLERIKDRSPRLSHPWMDAGYNGRGKGADRAERALGLDGTDRAMPTEGGPGGSDEGVGQGRSDDRLAEGAAG